jgi:hypothetical protein
MTAIEQLINSIETRLDELRKEIASLEAGRAELLANGGGRAASTGPPVIPQSHRRTRRNAPAKDLEIAPAGKLRRLLRESPDGLTTAGLAELASADSAQVLPLLREMEAGGQVRRTGQRRATRWHAVADQQEWIERRAAELAARSRSANGEAV